MKWLSLILKFFLGALGLYRERKEEQQKQTEEENRAAEEAAKETSREIERRANEVEKPNVDPSDNSEDPGGFGDWNRKRNS